MLHLVSAGMPGAGIITSAWNGWIHLPASNFPGHQFLCLMIQISSFTFRNFIPGNQRNRRNWPGIGTAKGMGCAELVFWQVTTGNNFTWENLLSRQRMLAHCKCGLTGWEPREIRVQNGRKNHSSGGIAFDLREINFLKSWKKRCSNQITDCCTSLKVR